MEGVWQGPGDGLAVEGGPVVLRVRIFLRRLSGRPSPLFDRLVLRHNQMTSLLDCIGQLTNLTVYDIQFLV